MTIADLRLILGELGEFWGGRDMGFLHQALYVHEFGETSVIVEGPGGRIDGYLLGFLSQEQIGYIHAVAVRREARGAGLARGMYERFEEITRALDARWLKAISRPRTPTRASFTKRSGSPWRRSRATRPAAGHVWCSSRRLASRLPAPGARSIWVAA